MKSLIALIALLPVVSFASTCYEAQSATPYGVPKTLCLTSISESTYESVLRVDSADGSFPSELNVDSFTRYEEDKVKFEASRVLVRYDEPGCGASVFAKVLVKGEADRGRIDPTALTVSVLIKSTPDYCHTRERETTVQYVNTKKD